MNSRQLTQMIRDDIEFVWYTSHTVYLDFGGVSVNEKYMYIN